MTDSDFFRPRHEPARTLYDAFIAEAAKRKGRPLAEWLEAEPVAVWQAACTYARQHALKAPTLEDVKEAERYARGSADYGAKWAYVLARKMTGQPA